MLAILITLFVSRLNCTITEKNYSIAMVYWDVLEMLFLIEVCCDSKR